MMPTLTPEEAHVLINVLDRAAFKGLKEAETALHLARKLAAIRDYKELQGAGNAPPVE